MSLLLDALKKAADDKQKSAQNHRTKKPVDVKTTKAGSTQHPLDEDIEPLAELIFDDEEVKASVEKELVLEDIEISAAAEPLPVKEIEAPAAVAVKAEGITRVANSENKKNTQQGKTTERPESSISGVSDEALSMLIYKTNRDVKQWKRTVFISVFFLSLIILAAGGVYFYFDTQSEIDELNNRHRIAMQAMRNKTSQEKVPQSSAIIRNLVSKGDLDDKVKFTKKQISRAKAKVKPARVESLKPDKHSSSNASDSKKSAASVIFQKTKKLDLISEKLEKAWQDYEAGRYESAKVQYTDVMHKEPKNRDAMLGLGAIAVIEENYVTARKTYRGLLKIDPRDPAAIAALTSLQSNSESLKENEMYLLEILQSNPDAAELNFALASNYAQQEKWKAAQQYYFSAWQHDPENADYLFNLAVSMDQLGKSTQAIQFYNDCLKQAKNRQVSFSRQAVEKRIAVLSAL